MRKLYLAIAVTALATMSVPASALSPQECAALRQRINSIKPVARTGGYTHAAFLNARAIEEAARDEMVRNRCNKKVNANIPLCQSLIARVNEAAANTRNARNPGGPYIEAAGAAEQAQLTARYDAECRNQAVRQRQQQRDAEAAAVAGAVIGLGLMGIMGGPISGRRTPPTHR